MKGNSLEQSHCYDGSNECHQVEFSMNSILVLLSIIIFIIIHFVHDKFVHFTYCFVHFTYNFSSTFYVLLLVLILDDYDNALRLILSRVTISVWSGTRPWPGF